MCTACAMGVPVCAAGACSPSVLGQLAIATGIPAILAIGLVRSWLYTQTAKYLPRIFNKELL